MRQHFLAICRKVVALFPRFNNKHRMRMPHSLAASVQMAMFTWR